MSHRSAFILTEALLTLAGPAVAQNSYHEDATFPSGIEGERIRSLIRTINAGDPAEVERFLNDEVTVEFRDVVPMEVHLDAFASAHLEWGSVAFHSIRTYTPPREAETVVILRDGTFGAWRALTLRFDDTPERRIAGIGLNDARPPSDVAEPELSEAGLVEEVASILDRVCGQDVFSGAVLMARGEEVLLSRACGEASKRFHVPNDVDTRFNLGSMNKMFTSVAVMQLVESGVVSVDDPISEYVDESWLPAEVTDRITVHHLLTHTSGLGSYFNETYWNSSRELYRALDDYKPLVRDERPAFEPGSSWQYSNTGMFLLGVGVPRRTNQRGGGARALGRRGGGGVKSPRNGHEPCALQ
jgi:hypothetical protein